MRTEDVRPLGMAGALLAATLASPLLVQHAMAQSASDDESTAATVLEERVVVLEAGTAVESLERVNPKYPVGAARERVEDTVVLRVDIDEEGKPGAVAVVFWASIRRLINRLPRLRSRSGPY